MPDAEKPRANVSRPTPEQIQRFSASTDDERFQWWIGMLTLVHDGADAAARQAWRQARSRHGSK